MPLKNSFVFTVQILFQAQIPKFRVEKEYELKEVLGSMGMAEAFMPSANFSKMSTEPLYISKVVHKTFIEVIFD